MEQAVPNEIINNDYARLLSFKGNRGYNIEGLIGERFGAMTIIAEAGRLTTNKSIRYFLIRCECGHEYNLKMTSFTSKVKSGQSGRCLECYREQHATKNIFQNYITTSMRTRCKEYGYELAVNAEDLERQWYKQDGVCPYTGRKLEIPQTIAYYDDLKRKKFLSIGNASLDRINSKIGYVIGNIQWVWYEVNWMKRAHSHEYFIHLCKTIASYHEGTEIYIEEGVSIRCLKRLLIDSKLYYKTAIDQLAFIRIGLRYLAEKTPYQEVVNIAFSQISDQINRGE